MLKIKIDFSAKRYTDTKLLQKAVEIQDRLKGNENFEDPSPDIAELDKAVNAMGSALTEQKRLGMEGTVIKKRKRKELETVLRKLAVFVQTVADQDEALILNSGFDLSRIRSKAEGVAKPENLSVKLGENKGTITLRCNPVKHASFYEFAYTETPVTVDSHWQVVTSTRCMKKISGLKSICQYAFRMAGADSSDIRIWSDEVIRYVL